MYVWSDSLCVSLYVYVFESVRMNLCVSVCLCVCVFVHLWVSYLLCVFLCLCVCVHCPLFNLPTGSLRAASSEYSETILVCLSNQQILEGETWFSGKDLSFQDA